MTVARAYELKFSPIETTFDLNHLKQIHRHLFQDVYIWAGEVRPIDTTKGGIQFVRAVDVPGKADKIFSDLQKDNVLKGLSSEAFVDKLTHYFAEVNKLHPFWEGNGRTQRIFFDQVAEHAGYKLDWSKTNSQELEKASKESAIGNTEPLKNLIKNITSERQLEKQPFIRQKELEL